MTTEFPETFDPETQEGNAWELLPVGEYVAQIVEASIQPPKSGDGCYLALTWKIVVGEFKDRQLWQRITFVHSSEQAQTIGRKTLKALCDALGVNEQVKDAEDFLFKPGRIRLGIERDKTGVARDNNRITGIERREAKRKEREQRDQPAKPVPATKVASAAKPSKPAPAGPAPWHAKR